MKDIILIRLYFVISLILMILICVAVSYGQIGTCFILMFLTSYSSANYFKYLNKWRQNDENNDYHFKDYY
jgi:hypothetical protein